MYCRDPRINLQQRVILGLLPFFHGYGFMTNIGAIIDRQMVVMFKKFEEEMFLKCIEEYKISTLFMVPPLMLILAKSPMVSKYDLSHVVEITCGAAPLSAELETVIKRRYGFYDILLLYFSMYLLSRSNYGQQNKI